MESWALSAMGDGGGPEALSPRLQLAETEADGVEPIGMSLLANLSFPPPADPQGKAGSTAVARQVLSSGGVEVLLSALVFAPTSRTGQWAAAALCVRRYFFSFCDEICVPGRR